MSLSDPGPQLADIAEEAGRLVMGYWRSQLEVSHKADASPVTEADRAGERLILQRLQEQFPGLAVVSEEHAGEFGTPLAISEVFFLVDPVDGTKAFVRGDVNFTVNIGLIQGGRPTAGAVVAPASGETWFTHGDQAWKRRIGEIPATPVKVRPWRAERAIALVSHTLSPDKAAALTQTYGFSERQPLDSSIKFCRIAEGSADIYPRHGPTMEWDIAAGHAVLQAAGGSVTDLEGGPLLYGKADQGFRNGWFVARGGPAEG